VVVISNINSTKAKKNHSFQSSVELYNLYEYLDIAKTCIIKYAPISIKYSMIKSEDAISYIVEKLIYGHCRYRKDGGSSLTSYLRKCVFWAILNWQNKLYHSFKETEFKDDYYYISKKEYYGDIKKDEKLDQSLLDLLTETQKYYLIERYVNNRSFADIGRDKGVSRQAVNFSIKNALWKMRDVLQIDLPHNTKINVDKLNEICQK
jgi:DNA-directed RNA polymerase specialized sigma24 family protein